jgi:hypothetical protein
MKQLTILLLTSLLFLNETKVVAQKMVHSDSIYVYVMPDSVQGNHPSKFWGIYILKELVPIIVSCMGKEREQVSRLFLDLLIDPQGQVKKVYFARNALKEVCESQLEAKLCTLPPFIPMIVDGKAVWSKYYLPIRCFLWTTEND